MVPLLACLTDPHLGENYPLPLAGSAARPQSYKPYLHVLMFTPLPTRRKSGDGDRDKEVTSARRSRFTALHLSACTAKLRSA